MNGRRSKLMRKLVAGLDMSDTAKYDEIRFTRKKRVYHADGTHHEVDDYPVRTLFLVKCKRAAYQRLKKLPKGQQDRMLQLVAGL